MDVGFVNHHDGTFWFIFDKVLEVGVRRERAGRIVGIADVEQSGIRRGGDHRFNVVRVSLGQRNLDDASSVRRGNARTSLVTGIGAHVASLRRGEGNDSEVKRRSRAGKKMDALRIQAFLLRKDVDEFVGEIVEIAAAERDDSGDGFTRGLAGTEGILIGVDHHAVRGKRLVTRRGGQHGLGDDSKCRSRGR